MVSCFRIYSIVTIVLAMLSIAGGLVTTVVGMAMEWELLIQCGVGATVFGLVDVLHIMFVVLGRNDTIH